MRLTCLFGHKWNGCTCSRCGTLQDKNHNYQLVPHRCEEKCAICGKAHLIQHTFHRVEGACVERCGHCGEEREHHQYNENGFCSVCGAQSPTPFSLRDLTISEYDAAIKAVEIACKANKDASLSISYRSAEGQLKSRKKDIGAVEMAIVTTALINVGQALAQSVKAPGMNPQELLARAALALEMNNAVGKLNKVMERYNAEASRRNGSDIYDENVKHVFQYRESIALLDPTGHEWEREVREDIDKLVAGGTPAMMAIWRGLNACSAGAGTNYDGAWWYGSVYIVRIIGMFPKEMALHNLLMILERDSQVAEWFTYVQKEAVNVLAKIADASCLPRLEKLLNKPFSMAPVDKMKEIVAKVQGIPKEDDSNILKSLTGTGVCDVCNAPLAGKKAWIVPNKLFYAAPGYREHQKKLMAMFGQNLNDAQVDIMIRDQASKDHSIGSAVCEDCIAMFEINGYRREK